MTSATSELILKWALESPVNMSLGFWIRLQYLEAIQMQFEQTRARIYKSRLLGLGHFAWHSPHFDSTWQAHAKRLHREFQWKVQRWMLEWAMVSKLATSQRLHCWMAQRLQRSQAPQQSWEDSSRTVRPAAEDSILCNWFQQQSIFRLTLQNRTAS